MQEIRIAIVNDREIPVLISDEKEALLAAKAAGRALIGLWRPEQEMDEIAAARYVVEDLKDVTAEYLERVARRYLGLPWHICETERLEIREMSETDFYEVWRNQIGRGFQSMEELETYTKNQYTFYEFGFWALVEKNSGRLVGMAGLTLPEDEGRDTEPYEEFTLVTECEEGEILELGYHIFPEFRRMGYAREACLAILRYGTEELYVSKFLVRIAPDNEKSKNLAARLGFHLSK